MRRSHSQISLTLWPFLDILSCLAGALTVIIATVLVTQIIPEPAAQILTRTKVREAKGVVAAKEAEIARYQTFIAEQKRASDELRRRRIEAMTFDRQVEKQSQNMASLILLLQQQEAVTSQINELQARFDRQTVEFATLKAPSQRRSTNNAPDRIEVHFSGRGKDLKPVFVECTRDGLLVRQGASLSVVRLENISASDEYRRILKRVQSTIGGTVIFLIRPSGVRAFELAEEAADKAAVRNGKLPIPGDGVIDLGPYTYAGPVTATP